MLKRIAAITVLAVITFGSSRAAVTPPETRANWKNAIEAAERAHVKGELAQAAAILERVSRDRAIDSGKLAITLNNLGSVYLDQNRFHEAEASYSRAVAILETLPQVDDVVYVRVLNNLVVVVNDSRQRARLDIDRLQRATARLAAGAPNHIEVARAYGNMAGICLARSQYAEAESLFHLSAQIYRSTHDYDGLATILSNLGALQVELKNYAGSMPFFEEALSLVDEISPPDYQLQARLLSNLAVAECKLQQVEQALAHIEKAASMAEHAFGRNHPGSGTVLRNYAQILRLVKRKKEAKRIERQANAILSRYIQENHLDATVNVHDLSAFTQVR